MQLENVRYVLLVAVLTCGSLMGCTAAQDPATATPDYSSSQQNGQQNGAKASGKDSTDQKDQSDQSDQNDQEQEKPDQQGKSGGTVPSDQGSEQGQSKDQSQDQSQSEQQDQAGKGSDNGQGDEQNSPDNGNAGDGQGSGSINFVGSVKPVNQSVTDTIPTGDARITIDGDNLQIEMSILSLAPNMTHMAYIMSGATCPSADDDANGDGFIDVTEGQSSSGSILVRLDADLRTLEGGSSGIPRADQGGSLQYMTDVSMNALLTDLHQPDDNPDDDIVKLAEGEDLDLANRVIMIHGMSANQPLPDSVESTNNLPAHLTIPIACIDLSPGEITPSP